MARGGEKGGEEESESLCLALTPFVESALNDDATALPGNSQGRRYLSENDLRSVRDCQGDPGGRIQCAACLLSSDGKSSLCIDSVRRKVIIDPSNPVPAAILPPRALSFGSPRPSPFRSAEISTGNSTIF